MYDAWYERPFGRYADRLEKNLISKLLPEVNRKLILDVGCGTGNYSITLAVMGAYVVGVDSHLPMVAVAKERCKKLRLDVAVVLADAGTLPFRAGVFDLSALILALCFIRVPRCVIEEMRRTTKQSGELIVGTLNKWSPYGIGKKIRSLFIESSYRSAIFHIPFELMRLVDAAEWHSTIFAMEWMPKWLLEVLYRTDNQLGRIFKPFGAFLATKVVILTAPAKAVIHKVQNPLVHATRGSHARVMLEVPFHRQMQEFTCGAACLMMAMKYLDPSLKLTRDLEIDIWREANLVEDWSTCGRGLAYSAAKRGFGARILASVDDIPFKEKILKISPKADRRVLEFFFRDMQKRALALDVKEVRRQVTVREIFSALEKGEVPIVLVNAEFLHREDVPHWVVVRGHDSNKVFIHDPLWGRPRRTGIGIHDFEEMIGYGAGRVMIAVLARSAKHQLVILKQTGSQRANWTKMVRELLLRERHICESAYRDMEILVEEAEGKAWKK